MTRRETSDGRVRMAAALLAAGLLLSAVAAAHARAADSPTVPAEIERSVRSGLDYLARTQSEDGTWPGEYGRVSGVVGLAIMTFLAHGDMPDDGKYGLVIRRAINYMVTTQQDNGLLIGKEGGSAMYSHAFATLALSEVYGMVDDPRVGPAVKKAVGLIVSAQNAQGGWRYDVGASDSDTTVAGAMMVALRAAAGAGIEVPTETVEKGVKYFKSCYTAGGGFGYTGPGDVNEARSGIGLLVLSLSGSYRSDEAKTTAEWLLARGFAESGSGASHYAAYYCSQAMFQAGGKYWRAWNDTATPVLLSRQKTDGSWQAREYGLCDTLFAMLAIEVNYKLLPIYQR